jgi:hypothetical protein
MWPVNVLSKNIWHPSRGHDKDNFSVTQHNPSKSWLESSRNNKRMKLSSQFKSLWRNYVSKTKPYTNENIKDPTIDDYFGWLWWRSVGSSTLMQRNLGGLSLQEKCSFARNFDKDMNPWKISHKLSQGKPWQNDIEKGWDHSP